MRTVARAYSISQACSFFIYLRKGNQYAKRPSCTWARAFTAVYSSLNFWFPTIHNNKEPRNCADWYNVLRRVKNALFSFSYCTVKITMCVMPKILLTSIWWPEPINHSTWACKLGVPIDYMFCMNNYINRAGARSDLFSSSGATDQSVLKFLDHTQSHARTHAYPHIYTQPGGILRTNDRFVEEATADTTRKCGHLYLQRDLNPRCQ